LLMFVHGFDDPSPIVVGTQFPRAPCQVHLLNRRLQRWQMVE